MSTPASADAPRSDALDHGSSGAPRYHAESQTVTVSRSTSRASLARCALVFASLGRMSTWSVVPSRFTDPSGRSTRAPGIVPEIVPASRTADASRAGWCERASISLGLVTLSAGTAGASGPTPNTVPAPRTISMRTPITARPEKTPDLDIGSVLRVRAGRWLGGHSVSAHRLAPADRFGQTALARCERDA